MDDLHGTVALMTGAGRGIGKDIAPALADAGADAVMVQRAMDRVVTEVGAIDILVEDLGDSIRKPLVPQPGPDATAPLGHDELHRPRPEPHGDPSVHPRLREVGLLTVYLASRASDYMTGQTLSLDGGLTL